MKLLCPNKSLFSKKIKSLIPKNLKSTFLNLNQKKFNKISKNYDIILMRFGLFLPYKKNSNIKFIITPTTGLNHIDQRYLFDKNVRIISLKNQISFLKKINSTVEFTILLLLLSLRNFYKLNNRNLEGKEIYNKKIGIIGYGRIGKKIEKILKSFEAKIYINDIKHKISKKNKSLNYILKNSDIIMLHIPLDNNNKFINKRKINLLKKNAIIINTSRGEIIDEDYLSKKMIPNNISYYTDVISNERNPDLKKFKNAAKKNLFLYTHHQAGLSKESTFKTEEFVLQRFKKLWIKKNN